MEDLPQISNGNGRELARVMPHSEMSAMAPLGPEAARGGVKRE